MRILLIGPHWGAGWTESTRDGLKELGYEVQVFYYNRTPGRQSAMRLRDRFVSRLGVSRAATPNLLRQLFWISNGWQLDYLIQEAVRINNPDLVLILKGETILPFTLRKIKQFQNPPILATWWVDSPVLYDERDKWWIFPLCVPIYDNVFIFDHAYLNVLRELNAKKVSFLPCAADPELFCRESSSRIRESNLHSSICFVGSFYPRRYEIIRAMSGIDGLAVWGEGWEPLLEEFGNSSIIRGMTLSPSSVSLAYQSASIVLNCHHLQTKRAGLNMRSFETLACGAFQLMDYVPEMESLLEPGHDVAVYHSPQEAADVAKEFLANPQARKRIANQGHERVLAEHTYKHRMQTILSSI